MTDEQREARTKAMRSRVNTEGIEKIQQDGELAGFLNVLSNFSYETFDNIMLIYLQNPEATWLMTYGRALNSFGRQVKAGEHAIHTISYAPDFEVGPELARDGKGNPIEPEWGGRNDSVKYVLSERMKFRDTKLFDILTQTEGKEIPDMDRDRTVVPEEYGDLIKALKKISPVAVYEENFSVRPGLVGNRDCAYDTGKQCLYLSKSLPPEKAVKALINGIARASAPEASSFYVDCTAYSVCKKFGIDTEHLSALFDNSREKIQSLVTDKFGVNTLNEFKRDMTDYTIRPAADIIGGVASEMALTRERRELNYEKEAECFGLPALYTERTMAADEVPKGMYAYKVIGSYFNEKTGKVGGPFCLTDLDNDKANVNVGGTIVVPKYIALNERGFLRLGKDDLAFADTGPLKAVMGRISRTSDSDLSRALQNRIIRSNEEIMWTDHGSRFALYQADEGVPYKNMPDYVMRQNFLEAAGEDYHYAYGGRPDNEETLKEFLGRFESGSDTRPVDYVGPSLSVGDVVVVNQYGRVSAAMVDGDGSLVDLPHFTEERYAEMFKNGVNTSLDNYVGNGGLTDRWSVGEKGGKDYASFCAYTQKTDDGQTEYAVRTDFADGQVGFKNYGTEKAPDRDTVMNDFKRSAVSEKSAEKSEKPEHREITEELERKQRKMKEQERGGPSIFGPNFQHTINR